MSVPRFFGRIYTAIGRHFPVSREAIEEKLARTVVLVDLTKAEREASTSDLLMRLLARLYPRVALIGGSDKVEAAIGTLRAINPDIEILSETHSVTHRVALGSGSDTAPAIHAASSGWVVRVSTHPLAHAAEDGPANALAGGAAASIAAALLFQQIFGGKDLGVLEVSVSLLDYSSTQRSAELRDVDLGEVGIIGLGAVSNAAIWALSRMPSLRGSFRLIDHESVDLSNLQRYVLTLDGDVGKSKTTLAARALLRTAFHVDELRMALEEAPAALQIERLPTLLVGVDSPQARRWAQAHLPRFCANAWTSESGLGASWHSLANESACLACLYQPTGVAPSQTEIVADRLRMPKDLATILWVRGDGLAESQITAIETALALPSGRLSAWKGKRLQDLYTEVICGSVALDLSNSGRLETVPLAHQSALAGILAAAELVKHSSGFPQDLVQAEPLVAWHDVMRPPPRIWTQARARVPGCFCSDPDYQAVFAEKWN